MFVDACAIVSLISMENTAGLYAEALTQAPEAWTSALAAFEAILVLSRPEKLSMSFGATEKIVSDFLSRVEIDLREPEPAHRILSHAIWAAQRYGVGRRKLSSFDCFHYAYAKATKSPMLTSDELLRATDLVTLPSRLR